MSKPLSRRSFLRRAASAVAVASLPAMQVAPQIEELAIRPVEGEMDVMDDTLSYSPHGYIVIWGSDGGHYRIPVYG
jgi:hypothetical protein